MKAITRRTLLVATAAIAPASTQLASATPDPLVVNDQSRLNATRVSRNLVIAPDPRRQATASLEAQFKADISDAVSADVPFCVGGARHSMGGQSLPPRGGVAAVIASRAVDIDTAKGAYSVVAGARWRDVIAALDPHGFSPAVMQSNNDFAVGGAIGVNAHGWAVPHGPVGSTVRRLRLVLADGTPLTCSPTENPDLFSACLGGYGLFGAIVEAELAFEKNVLLDRGQTLLPASEFAARFVEAVHTPGVRMAYGRLSLARHAFLDDAILVSYRPSPVQPAILPPPSNSGLADGISRGLFRGQTGSDAGKQLRWWAETHLMEAVASRSTRNDLLNSPVSSFAGTDASRTDILHEYFIPPPALESFLHDCRRIIPSSHQDLLNVTLRWVEADRRSILAFAPEARIAVVMLYSQAMTSAAETDMRALTQRLIDAALATGGSFYLPYRLHARPDQVRAAYPQLPAFLAAKRRWDPQLRFRNQMWDSYFARL